MKKYFLLIVMAIFAVSCSKKIDVKGNFSGGSPLERVEFIDASSVATLPLVNLGMDEKGNFSGSFDAPKSGMYVMSYAGKQALVYLKPGQEFHISGAAVNFPNKYTVTGDAKKNNDFIIKSQEFFQKYASGINMGQLIMKDEASFLKEITKIKDDVFKNMDSTREATGADSEVVTYMKDQLTASLLTLMAQYETLHPQAVNNPSFKVSQKFKDEIKKMEENGDRMVANLPAYRNYLFTKLAPDYQTFDRTNNKDGKLMPAEVYSNFLDTRKEISQKTKDYLLSFVLTQTVLHPNADPEHLPKAEKLIDEKIKDSEMKKSLQNVHFIVTGPKIGEPAPTAKLVKADGKDFKIADLKGKPAVLMFYASWNPYIAEGIVPVVKEVSNFYKDKMNFVYINLDDSKEQFTKTSAALMKGIDGHNVYGEGGMNAEIAKKYGIYGFKVPSFIVVDKDGKIASKFYYSLGEQEVVDILDKLTGLKAPQTQSEVTIQNDWLAPADSAAAPNAKTP